MSRHLGLDSNLYKLYGDPKCKETLMIVNLDIYIDINVCCVRVRNAKFNMIKK